MTEIQAMADMKSGRLSKMDKNSNVAQEEQVKIEEIV